MQTNWAGNYRYRANRLHVPKSVAEVQEVVKSCSHVRALGTRHSFNGIADSAGDQVSLENLDEMLLDQKARTVTVGAGVTYGQLSPYLYSNGFALHNLASLPHTPHASTRSKPSSGPIDGRSNSRISYAIGPV